MWVYLNDAFVSAVEHKDDHQLLVVRARVEGDLERFFRGMNINVQRHEDRDYLFRTIVTKQTFARQLSAFAEAIDYPNFKGSIASSDHDRHDAYLRVWSVMANLQYR
ncbi:MAG TPA: hypothetical protein VFK50_05385 [Sphingomicrobium sp.]|nr:hypothetical protein [Sphingomicrobium sp.]